MYYEILTIGIVSVTAFSVFVAVPLYIIVLVIIGSHRNVEPFNSAFFLLFFALGVDDVVCYLLFLVKKFFFFGYIPSFFLPFGTPNALLPFFNYPIWVFGFYQYELLFFLSFNRFVAIVFPTFYNTHWTVKRTKILIFTCFIICLALCFPTWLSATQMSQYTVQLDGINRTFQAGPAMLNTGIVQYMTFVWTTHVYGLLVTTVFFYTIMIVSLRKNKMIENKKKMEMQMFHLGFMLFVLNFIYTAYFILRNYFLPLISTNSHLHEWILYFISDIYDLPNGFMLIFISSSVRKIIKTNVYQILRCGKVDFKPMDPMTVNTIDEAPLKRPTTGMKITLTRQEYVGEPVNGLDKATSKRAAIPLTNNGFMTF